jgi:hypothetical protein
MNLYPRLTQRARLSVILVFGLLTCAAAIAQKIVSIPEEIEWTWEVRPPHPDPKLPNVLLLGDSISRNYFPQVTRDLAGTANVYLMASSTSVGDPRLLREIREFATLQKVPFRVVHFNNGMHGWGYTEAQYRAQFPAFLHTVRALAGTGGTLIWATTTPVKKEAANGATNPRVDARNAIAQSLVQKAGIPIDDQHALMSHHTNLYQDTVHFNSAGSDLMGDQAAATIRTQLQR